MNRLISYSLYILIALSVFFACESSTDIDDKEKPRIEMVYVSDIMYVDSTYISSDTSEVTKGANIVQFICTDNSALSSYKIHLLPSANMINPDSIFNDSLAFNNAIYQSQKQDIFGEQTATIKQSIRIEPGFQRFNYETNKNETYKIRTGNYAIWLVCVDKAGNKDSVYAKDIVLRYPSRYYTEEATEN